MRSRKMTRLFPACLVFLLFAADVSPALENLRVAYPLEAVGPQGIGVTWPAP